MKSFWAHGESFGWDYPHCFVSWPVTASPSPEDTFNCASSLAVVPCFARAAHQRESPSLVSMERERELALHMEATKRRMEAIARQDVAAEDVMAVRRSAPQDVMPPESVELRRRTSLAVAEESEDDAVGDAGASKEDEEVGSRSRRMSRPWPWLLGKGTVAMRGVHMKKKGDAMIEYYLFDQD